MISLMITISSIHTNYNWEVLVDAIGSKVTTVAVGDQVKDLPRLFDQ